MVTANELRPILRWGDDDDQDDEESRVGCGPSTDRGHSSLGAVFLVTKLTPNRCQQV
jgi:hypothetical protein